MTASGSAGPGRERNGAQTVAGRLCLARSCRPRCGDRACRYRAFRRCDRCAGNVPRDLRDQFGRVGPPPRRRCGRGRLRAFQRRFAGRVLRGDPERASVWVVKRDGSRERRLVAAEAGEPILTEFRWCGYRRREGLVHHGDWSADARGHRRRTRRPPARRDRRWRESALVTRRAARGGGVPIPPPDPYGEREAICFTLTRGGPVQRFDVGIAHRPLWAPDGSRVAFTGSRGRAVCASSTCGAAPFADSPIRRRPSTALTWSPDRRRIAYATAAGELFTIAGAGGRPRRVGRFRDVGTPAWGPGGRRIAFSRRRLWTVRPDGTGASRVTREVLSGTCPVDSSTAASVRPGVVARQPEAGRLGAR